MRGVQSRRMGLGVLEARRAWCVCNKRQCSLDDSNDLGMAMGRLVGRRGPPARDGWWVFETGRGVREQVYAPTASWTRLRSLEF